MTFKQSRAGLLVIVLTGMLFRAGLLAPRIRSMEDPDNYLPMARSIVEGHGLAFNGRLTAYRPPLYPILIAPILAISGEFWPIGIATFQILLGGATIALTWISARSWGISHLGSLLASILVAFDPVLAVQSRSVMTETLAAALVTFSLTVLAYKRDRSGPSTGIHFFVAGISFGLCVLCRPSLLPGVGCVLLARLFVPRFGWSSLTALALGVGITLSPWSIRNFMVVGGPIVTTTHGGYTLALANNPAYYADVLDGPPNAVWSGPNQQAWWNDVNERTQGMSEPEADRFLRNSALRLAVSRPFDFLRASLARLGRFWGLAPSGEVYPWPMRVATCLWTIPFWLAVGVGLSRRTTWEWPNISGICMVFGLMVVHAFYWTDLRMRAPIVPALALIAASAWIEPSREAASVAPKSTV